MRRGHQNLLLSPILTWLAVSSILFLLILSSNLVRFHVQAGRAIPKSSNLSLTGNAAEEVMKMRSQIGSRPPRCEKRCSSCGHCEAIQIPISPQLTRNHDGDRSTSSLSYVSNTEYAKGDEYDSNYKPMSWKCKCGNFIFNP
ncbi:EPIDERMAL PATTERNING FACTOR-like protein 2 [Linum grandiflorum]